MAEIRCQMCGKPNPPHLQECQHCGARLKPLIAASPSTDKESGSDFADASQKDTLGWLRSLGQEDEASTPENTDDLPDWLAGSPSETDTPSEPDWMRDVGRGDFSDTGSLAEADQLSSPDTESNLNQWLPTEGLASYSENEEGELDDFLGDVNYPGDSGSLPSWLSDQDDERLDKTVPISEIPGAGYPSRDEDWLNSIGNEDSVTATLTDWKQQTPDVPTKDPVDDLPGWLTSSAVDESPAEISGFDDDLPSWLSGGNSLPTDPEPSSGSPSETDLEGEFPDWLDTLSSKTGMTGKLGQMPQWIDENESATTDESTFDWLATLGDTPEEQPVTDDWKGGTGGGLTSGKASAIGGLTFDPEDSFISEVGQGENPDWLQNLQEPEENYLEPSDEITGFQSSWGFDQKTEPETWQASESQQAELSSSTIEDSGISGGLPSWVKAFRPMDGADIAIEHTDGELERVGPLAGLRDLLTPEADISKTAKPPTYSSSLQVSTSQQTNTQLLQSLVETENIPQSVAEPSPLSSQRILRITFGVVLILAMLFPLISGTEIVPLPQQALPQEIQNIENLSNGAPLDLPILVAFDYEPGLSGELEAAASALFDHWMTRGIPLAIVSTSPVGSGLGERQIAYLQSRFPYDHQYVYGEDYVNLGYIAGGTAGLANFALIPRQSLKMAFDNRPIWQLLDFDASNPWLSSVMQPITSLADFSMTAVLTDNPETARQWIEQVEPALRSNSLVMIVSAQAEPFVRPYYQNPDSATRQVEGLLVGLRGGASYEYDQGNLGVARLYWDAFGVGLLVAVVLILAGGGYNYLDELRKVRRKARRNKSRN